MPDINKRGPGWLGLFGFGKTSEPAKTAPPAAVDKPTALSDGPKTPDKNDFVARQDRPSVGWSSSFSAPSRLVGDLPADAPIAATQKSIAAGFSAPPTQPRIFVGAKVEEEGGGAKGVLVGYTSSGSFLVQTNTGETKRINRVTPAPGQQFQAVGQTLPKSQVVAVSGPQQKALQALLGAPVGSGKKNVDDAIQAIRGAGFEVFIAGGAVRDAVQGQPARDVDLATTMWIQEADKALSRANIPTGMTRSEFGTMIVGRGTAGELDVCSLKAGKGSFGLDLTADIKFRDFTINAMFYDPANGVILDPTGHGHADAVNKVLRPSCKPGDEKQWFSDNPSVVLRFLKFTLRGYSYDAGLLKMIKDNFASCVGTMDTFRRDRQLDSVVPSGDRKAIITAEMTRLGFPQSDIDAVFPKSSFRSSFSGDDDDGPSPRTFGSGFTQWGSTKPSDKSTPTKPTDLSGTPQPGLYLAPSIKAVQEYGQAKKKTVIDYAPRHESLAAVKVGRLAPQEDSNWSSLREAGFRKQDDRYVHFDGSYIQFVKGNVFRGVDDKVFAGRPPLPSNQDAAGTTSSRAPSTPSSIDRLRAADAKLSPLSPTWSDHGKLAVATGHLSRLPSNQTEANDELKKKGFVELIPGHWEHSDESWVRFFDGNVFRGFKDQVFTSMISGPGPQS
jgi:soluble P-type ATPase